jgi:hypothetical protein
MHCILFYQNPIIEINSKTQAKKGLISYYKTNKINCLYKHVDAKHTIIAKRFEEEVNIVLKITKKYITIKENNKYVYIGGQSLNFFFQKGGCVIKRVLKGPWSFDCQKQLTNSICKKYMVEVVDFMFMSKLNFPF